MEEEIEEAVATFMEAVRAHKLANSGVPQEVSAEFYEGLAEECRSSAQCIREEMGG